MTQDPYGQPAGPGYVVRGEVVPDDEANVTPPRAPMTHFQKVASALREDRTDPAIPVQGAPTTSPDAQDASGAAGGADDADDGDHDATRPQEVIAVQSPDAGSRDYWDDQTGPQETVATASSSPSPSSPSSPSPSPDGQDPMMTQPDLYGTAVQPEPAAATEPAVVGAAAEASAPAAPAAPAAPVEEGLRPGESDSALGDFSDLTYGSLLPDAAEFKAQWQQVQFRFVDDPQGSVTEAADVISQVTAKLEAAIAERQRAIAERQRTLRDRWSQGKSTDTESLRETLLMYRTFLDQLTGPKDG
jgi:hypothetical protein